MRPFHRAGKIAVRRLLRRGLTEFDGETEPEKNTSYYGAGFYQRISTHHAHQQFDWIIRNNLLNHTTVAWDRWFMGGNSLAAGAGWPRQLWGPNQGGLLDNTAGPPVMTFGGNIPYTAVGQNWQRFGYEKNDRWQFSNDVTWAKGRHAAKVGFEYRNHRFPSRGWAGGGAWRCRWSSARFACRPVPAGGSRRRWRGQRGRAAHRRG